jgi:hypothetical protein
VEFVLKGGAQNPIMFNHSNWMGNYKADYEMVCVDGLQRTTALIKFTDNKLPIFGGYLLENIHNLVLSSFHVKIMVNNLKTRKEVLKWYLELNEGGVVHSKEELDRVRMLIDNHH